MEAEHDKDAEVPCEAGKPRDHTGSRMWRSEVQLRLRAGMSHSFEVIRIKTIPRS